MILEDIFNDQVSFHQEVRTIEKDLLFHHCEQSSINHDALSFDDQNGKFHSNDLNRQSTQQLNEDFIATSKTNKQKKKRVRKYISTNPNNKKGHWTKEQSLKYHYFLELNADYFIDSERRKTDKIFKSMSNFIETREPHQCRSHHQKIQKKWGLFSNILLNLRIKNFRSTKIKTIIQSIQKLGINNPHIYSDHDLRNQEQLFKKIRQEREQTVKCYDSQQFQQNNVSSGIQEAFHNPNCMCLMMSQKYQDQLCI